VRFRNAGESADIVCVAIGDLDQFRDIVCIRPGSGEKQFDTLGECFVPTSQSFEALIYRHVLRFSLTENRGSETTVEV
jgi:hypothetical protein